MRYSYLEVLGFIFVTLKLANMGVVATWSWWWVLSPLIVFFIAQVILGVRDYYKQ